MKKSILYLISLLAMMFIAIPKISNAAAPEEEENCRGVYVYCDDGSIGGMGVVCNDSDYETLQELFCNVDPIPPSPGPVN